jgi:glycosyltransferase involved in cell wall biosynthesis
VTTSEHDEESPLRILFVGLNYEPESAGIGPYTSGMARGLAQRGHDVRVITSYPHYPQWKVRDGYRGLGMHEVLGGARVHRVRHYVPPRPATPRRILMEAAFGVRALASAWVDPDVVVAVSPALISSAMISARTRRQRQPRLVTWVQDIYTLGAAQTGESRVTRLVREVERRLLQRSDRVVVIHDRFRAYLHGHLDISTRVDVVRNWTHVEPAPTMDRIAVRRRHGWADDDVVVLHAGNMGAKQGLENVVHAARVAANTGSRVRFVLMGDGLRRQALEALDPSPRLEFLNPLPDGAFQEALGAADILLVNELPGLTEMSVPSKLTTYWVTGRPVVAAVDESSTTAEEISTSGAGLVVPPAAPERLVAEIEALAADPGRYAELAAAGHRFAECTLREATSVDAFEAVLRSVVNEESGARAGRPISGPP